MRVHVGREAERVVTGLARRELQFARLEPKVRRIIENVRRHGDRALRKYAVQWDSLQRKQAIRVLESEMKDAWASLSPPLRASIREAARNIRHFCQWQKPAAWKRTHNEASLGQLVLPLDSVGCYVPGGRYPLVSTLLMTVIPAQVAGVENVRVVSPRPSREVLGAAALLGVREFYRIGGAQAIAALAHGTKTIPRVDKIVGPGNSFVTVAKKLVSFDCAIDFLAGPTEAVVLSNSGNPTFLASDLVAQAEHDPEAISIFITASRPLAQAAAEKIPQLAAGNPTAQESLRRHGAILLAASRDQAREWANQLAPEHITVDPDDLPFIRSAGSIFVGNDSPQAAGDYASGPNHVLPTAGQARFRGGLSVLDFVKIITVQRLSRKGLRSLAPTVRRLAEAEGLPAHSQSVRVRCEHA